MRFMMLYKPGKETDAPPSEQEMAALGQLIEEMAKAGVLLATDGLQPSSKGARVRISGGKFTVTDGPFTETDKGADRGLRDRPGEVEGRGDRIGQALPQGDGRG